MIPEVIETERLIFKPFRMLSIEEKLEIGKSWANPFNARFNGQRNPYTSVESLASLNEPTFRNFEDAYDVMYFRAVFDKKTEELVGTCRLGKYWKSENFDTWDFGFNVILKHWCKGYGVDILKTICELARKEGAKFMRGGACNDNFGSYNAMVKNGFRYNDLDEDRDFQFLLDLSAPPRTKEEIKREWDDFIKIYDTRPDEENATFGKEKRLKLKKINDLIKEMVARIQAGEDEDKLVAEYFEICNALVEFPEKSVGY